MKRRRLLQSGLAALALPALGRGLAQSAKSETHTNRAAESHSGMRAYVGDLTYSGSTGPALVVEAGLPRRLAASWLHPGEVRTTVGRYLGYESAERAYRFEAVDHRVDFELQPLAGHAQINPVVVVKNWANGNPRVTLDQREPQAMARAVSWTGNRLIVWFRREVTSATHISIEGWPGVSWRP